MQDPNEVEQISLLCHAVLVEMLLGANSTMRWSNHQKQDILRLQYHETSLHLNQK